MKAQSIRIDVLEEYPDRARQLSPESSVLPHLLPKSPLERGGSITGDYLLLPENITFPRTRRLVVLVPAADFDVARLGVKIGKIALPSKVSILFLALASDPKMDSAIRRRLSTLAWLVKDQHLPTSVRVAYRENWIRAVEEVWKEGDLVLCLDGHRIPALFSAGSGLAPRLVSTLKVPVYVLAGLKLEPESRPRGGWRIVVTWSAAILVIILFGLIQVFIERISGGGLSTLLLSLSVVLEIIVIWKLNLIE
jgi:hypothetical protein